MLAESLLAIEEGRRFLMDIDIPAGGIAFVIILLVAGSFAFIGIRNAIRISRTGSTRPHRLGNESGSSVAVAGGFAATSTATPADTDVSDSSSGGDGGGGGD